MADTGQRYKDTDTAGTWATGLSIFAGAMMLTTGFFQVLQGIVALADDSFYTRVVSYTYDIDVTAWGWTHIILGAVVAAVGIGVLLDQTWARVTGVFVVLLQMFSNFLFLPYYPLWGIVILALDVAVVWALAQPTRQR